MFLAEVILYSQPVIFDFIIFYVYFEYIQGSYSSVMLPNTTVFHLIMGFSAVLYNSLFHFLSTFIVTVVSTNSHIYTLRILTLLVIQEHGDLSSSHNF